MDELRQRVERWTLGPVFPAFTSILFFILAAAAALFPGEIREHTRAFLEAATELDPARPSVWVIAFWGTMAALASLVYLRYRSDGYSDGERMRRMLQVLHRSPDPNVFGDYPQLFRAAEARVRGLAAAAADPPEARRNASLEAIHAVLSQIIDLTRYFAPAPRGTLRASILLVAEPSLEGPDAYPEPLIERLRFFDRGRHRLEGLRALLFLPPDLVVGRRSSRSGGAPLIALPVSREAETRAGHQIALPGAPYALLTGRPCVYEDTRVIADEWCADLEKAVREEIGRFYGKGGEGSHTRSFVSLRLGGETDPIGVLNIESDETHVLGHEPEYYVTFFSLVSPLLHLLAGPVATYDAASRELELLYEPGRVAEPEAVAAGPA